MADVTEFDIAASQHIAGLKIPLDVVIECRMCDHQRDDTDTDWWPAASHDAFFPFTKPVCSVPHAETCNQITHVKVLGPFEIILKK
jgi:hypothetical protein